MKNSRSNEFTLRSLVMFFGITYLFSWLFWVPEALAANGVSVSPALNRFLSGPFNPAAYGPLVAAFILTLSDSGIKGIINLLKRGIDLRFGKKWLIPVFFVFPLIYGITTALACLSGWMKPVFPDLSNPGTLPVAFVFILLFGGPLQEEFGWRGYALDRLQARYSALLSSIILGIFWSLWHLPAAFCNKLIVPPELFWIFIIQVTLTSILFTWIYNNTNRSLLPVLLFHTVHNMTIWLVIPDMKMTLNTGLCSILLLSVAVVIVLTAGSLKKQPG